MQASSDTSQRQPRERHCPPPPSRAPGESRRQPPVHDTASAASTRAKRAMRTASKGNTGASATGCAEGEDAATHSAVAEGNTLPQFLDNTPSAASTRGAKRTRSAASKCNTVASTTGCTEGPSAATHSAVAEGNTPPHFLDNTPSAASVKCTTTHSTARKGNTVASATGWAEGQGTASHSTVAEGKAPPHFLDDIASAALTGGAKRATLWAEGEGAATHSTVSLLALDTANVGLSPPLFAAARTSSTVGDMLEGGSPPPFMYAETHSDYDNDDNGDLLRTFYIMPDYM